MFRYVSLIIRFKWAKALEADSSATRPDFRRFQCSGVQGAGLPTEKGGILFSTLELHSNVWNSPGCKRIKNNQTCYTCVGL
jgi:hypothetical protein